MTDNRTDEPGADQPERNREEPVAGTPKPQIGRISRLADRSDEDIETDANGIPVLVEPKLRHRNRLKPPMIHCLDKEYSDTIIDDWRPPAPQGDTASPPCPALGSRNAGA